MMSQIINTSNTKYNDWNDYQNTMHMIDMNLHYDPSNVCSQYNQHTVGGDREHGDLCTSTAAVSG